MSLADVGAALQNFFVGAAHQLRRRDSLVSRYGNVPLVVAAIQNLDDVMYEGRPAPSEPLYVAQPCIRLRYLDDVGKSAGFSTSFVNVSTYQFGASFDRYQEHLDRWLKALGSIGLALNGLSLIEETVPFCAGPYFGWYIVLNHRGREIGEGIFIERATTSDGRKLSLLEFTFGLERILWAINGNRNYGQNVGSPTLRIEGAEQMADACRTATLLAMTGASPSSVGLGVKVRRLVSRLTDSSCHFEQALRYSYGEWSNFITPRVPLADCIGKIADEVCHGKMVKMARCFGSSNALVASCRTSDELILKHLEGGARIDELCERYEAQIGDV